MRKKNLLILALSAICMMMALASFASDKKEDGKKGDEKECKITKITVPEQGAEPRNSTY